MIQMDGKLRKKIILGLVFCMSVIFCVPALAAQEPVFRLDMDNLNLQKGVSSNLVVSMANAEGAKINSIEGLENFDVISQNSSTSISIAGNESAYREDLYYTVMPKTTGEFTLKAIIQYDGRTYETNVLQVTVGEGSSGEGEAESDLFVKTIISQTDAYLGEKVVVTYELYTRYNIENFGFTDYTAIDGVISKDMPADQLKAEYVYLDGARYAKYEVKQLILDPIKAGTHTIPSFNLQVNVITDDGPGGIFGGPGGLFSRTQPMYLQTEEKELMVKLLPLEGRPNDFSGIIGELQLDGRYSREELNYGDSLSHRITAFGNCNLDALKKIFFGELPGFAVYETQKNSTESIVNNRYHVQKEFEVILVPEKNGTIEIAPVSISYFNPATEKYERAEIPGTVIEVLGDMPQSINNVDGQPAVIETVSINQVNYDTTNDGYFTIQMNKQVLYGVLIGIGVLLVLTALFVWLASSRKKQDETLKSLYKQLTAAKDANEVFGLFNSMIKHCYNLSLKASSQSDVRSSLPNADIAERIMDIMNYMESSEAKICSNLKDKIKIVYNIILRNGKPQSQIQMNQI